MLPIPADIFTEPEKVSPDGLANLGPLRHLAGVWQADKGVDVNPKAEGPERRDFSGAYPDGPDRSAGQRTAGLLWFALSHPHQHARGRHHLPRSGRLLAWEPATGLILQSVTIPRGQVLLAAGHAKPDDKKISVTAKRGDTRSESAQRSFWTKLSARRVTDATSPSTTTEAGPISLRRSFW